MRTNASSRVAAVVVALEGLGILALVAWQLVALISGDTDSIVSSVALIVLTATGALAVLAFAAGVWRGLSWGSSGAIVTQLLILAIALGAVTGAYADGTTALALALPALVALALLIVSVRRRPHGAEESETDAAASD